MFERFFKNRYGYSRWDGTQQVEGLDADEILKALSDDYMENGNLQQALKRLMQDGMRSDDGRRTMGLRELMERMREQRNQQLNRYNMASGVMDDLREKLEEIKQLERAGIQRRLDGEQSDQQQAAQQPAKGAQGQEDQQQSPGSQSQQGQEGQQGESGGENGSDLTPEQKRKMLEMIAKRKQDYLDNLPADIPGQVKGLSEYDFMDDQAREKFKELMDSLQQQMMQQFFQGMQQSLQNMTPEDIARMREMIRDLNKMLRERQEGKEPDFDSFMQKHGEYFPGVNSLDDLIEQMQQQMAAMQGIMDNLSSEQQEELQNLMEQLMGDDRIRVDLMELAQNLEAVAPMENMRTRFNFRGDESLPLNEAMRMMSRLQQMEGLEDQLSEARRMDNLEAIDSEKVKELLGDEEYQSVEQLKELMKMLEEAGYIQKRGNRWELTARGIRKIGQKALQDIFNKLKRDGFGRHVSPFRGVGGERTDESKVYQFGDPFLLDLEKTLMNALHRRGTGTPVGLQKEDFEVYRTEFTTQSSTVLMIDMSLSMIYNGCQPAAKKVAVALESLIRSQFPRDNLYIVGFSRIAQEFKPNELIEMSTLDNQQGTNMAHGLMLSRQLLARHRGVNKQIIMITDGGPTVWYEDGEWLFNWPYNHMAEQQTLLEVQRCTREGITINTFMLEDDNWMIAFVNQMSQINHGRTFYADKNNLGEYLLVDYLNSKRKIVS
ncbi:MAG: VWA domain-containing protein [Ktedonobacter sp. 13_1_20CM_4_53_11]|nr:MAG: VWA domain-containing protein [Ktedonobacter sp. 13_2_20CM_53_11]OLE02264.1 MAG: VWA domain-containing protein [Ktedonobacter sp. 13_1_20CM_4_53_11]TMC94153.1 MAG: VWA domain-containing protein [Chloroflexota bacterium]TMD47629.1 MAG: VWA domain-containing protein [Chloroflexota bacterium]TMD92105.1 MAG: VWA domain-containing protein [Chloroflexota bacterium]